MNGGGASATYHDKATWAGSSAGHITNSISADLADWCTSPHPTSTRSWIHPSSLGHIHLNVLTTSHKFTALL